MAGGDEQPPEHQEQAGVAVRQPRQQQSGDQPSLDQLLYLAVVTSQQCAGLPGQPGAETH